MILVIGTGRCGSSTIARLLHNNLQISMGERFREPDDSNLNGFYEDLDFRDLNHQILHNRITNDYFQKEIDRHVTKRRERWGGEHWGIKDPRICNLWLNYKRYNAQYIWCVRKPEMVVRSLVANYGWSGRESRHFVAHRLNSITKLLEGQDALRIDFSTKRDESELTNLLKRNLE